MSWENNECAMRKANPDPKVTIQDCYWLIDGYKQRIEDFGKKIPELINDMCGSCQEYFKNPEHYRVCPHCNELTFFENQTGYNAATGETYESSDYKCLRCKNYVQEDHFGEE